MTTALQSAEHHLADLAANRVPARDKPSAFHHGLITTLVAELKAANERLAAERKARDDDQREFQREARDIAAEARWAERQEHDERGSY
jgi:hypothetical protein